ncbi:hypothetical protein Tco_1494735 [Tanacetum coccineum]
MLDKKLMFVDDEKPLTKVDYDLVNADSDSDVEVAYDKTTQFMASGVVVSFILNQTYQSWKHRENSKGWQVFKFQMLLNGGKKEKFIARHHLLMMIRRAVVTKSGQVRVNAAKQSSPRAATSITAKTNNFNEKVNNVRVNNVTTAGPKAVVSVAVGNGKNVVKSSACWIWRPTGNVIDHNSKDSGSYMLKRFNYADLQGRLKSVMA